jgi:transcriptional regulator with GAF, ATPase, and Fis domain
VRQDSVGLPATLEGIEDRLALAGQVKLLRVLEAHEIQRVGSDQPIRVDTRVVAATNRNVRRLGEQGRFREDQFWRSVAI